MSLDFIIENGLKLINSSEIQTKRNKGKCGKYSREDKSLPATALRGSVKLGNINGRRSPHQSKHHS